MNLCFPDKEFSEQYLSSRSTKIDANRSQWQSFLSTSISQSKNIRFSTSHGRLQRRMAAS
ncbi:hypothetical protein BFJ63_vAg5389 [Fusarium oxysporum f. sp. narcissi]|uniref:Uncharacterized protein n=2 Tax=Fusarium oxysporum TaxID=5507 RepID=A0A420TKQ9_FUSOX|nr:hypothetical protein BFJ67_g5254 [Fusarium oxysporum f. sp. cepae]RKL00403.1 hypothetical protein BFJ68_g12815 [Fusarium oxysporum]RKL03179.1 hypothetical protein BFJ71_g4274 [Fusarium oxysporum]RKL42120.1 hypothetical protein BFJ70_g4863 [Fusarium oxysporum]RYC91946.1 hypothetical protein BFJ63_vAg5389 [Fusarium oxysporum f. sp. narcissi]